MEVSAELAWNGEFETFMVFFVLGKQDIHHSGKEKRDGCQNKTHAKHRDRNTRSNLDSQFCGYPSRNSPLRGGRRGASRSPRDREAQYNGWHYLHTPGYVR